MKPARTLAFLSFVFAVTLSIAQTEASQGLLQCSAIKATTERLACYDALADSAIPPVASNADHWNINVDTNPVDDTKTVVVTTEATDDSSNAQFGDEFVLILRCQSGEIDAYIKWFEFLGSDTTQVTYRIGTQAAKTDTWYISTDNLSTFFSQNEPANKKFIDDLVAADNGRLVAQVTPYSESSYVAIFNVAGLSKIVNQLYEPCA